MNVLILMSDEQRIDTLGCYGNTQASTPNLDALAANGIRFDHCVTPYPLCCPARCSLWTGSLPHQHHVIANWVALNPAMRDTGMVQDFSKAGYHTMYIGKWHVPGTTPNRMGFAQQACIPAVLEGRDRGRYIEEYRDYVTEKGYTPIPGNIENLTKADEEKRIGGGIHCGTSEYALEDYLEEWQTRRFLEEMETRPKDKPFFAVCSYNAPHFPMIVPEPYDKLISPEDVKLPENFCIGAEGKPEHMLKAMGYEHTSRVSKEDWQKLIAHYWGLCSLVDTQVGRIVQYLKDHDLYEDTLIVYTSDHGDMIGSHGLNHKSGLMQYDETNLVPLIMAGPCIGEKQSKQMLVSLADLMPTIAELCQVPIAQPLYGRSFAAPLQAQEDTFRDYTVSEGFLPRDGQHRPIIMAIRTQTEKYIYHQDRAEEFYDLVADPGENYNMIGDVQVEAFRNIVLQELSDTPALQGLVAADMKNR